MVTYSCLEWCPVRPELDPPELLVPIRASAVPLATVRRVGLDWDVDAVICNSSDGCLPGVLIRPRVHLPLDRDAVRTAFGDWCRQLRASRRMESHLEALPDLMGLLRSSDLHRIVAPIEETREYWENRSKLLTQWCRLPAPALPPEDVLVDYPFVVASLPSEKLLWDRGRPENAPSGEDSRDRIVVAGQGRGRPRSTEVASLAVELLWCLDGLANRWKDISARLGAPVAAWFALEVARRGPDHPEVRRVEEEYPDHVASVRAAHRVCQSARNLRKRWTSGRRGEPGLRDVRLIAPYLVPDLSSFPRHGELLPEATPALVESWLETGQARRMLDIVRGRDPATMTPPADPSPGVLAAHARLAALDAIPRLELHAEEHERHVRRLRALCGTQPRMSPNGAWLDASVPDQTT